MHWIGRKGSAEVIKIIFSLRYITVFIYFWLNINYRGTIEPCAAMYKEMKKIKTGNRVITSADPFLHIQCIIFNQSTVFLLIDAPGANAFLK
jgi:uncharacterized membrane protein